MMTMLPGYTLERLQDTDIDLLLPLYFWYCRTHSGESEEGSADENIVMRGGKPYRVQKDASWA